MKNEKIHTMPEWSMPTPYLDLVTEMHYEISTQEIYGEIYFKIRMVELGEEVIVPSTILALIKQQVKND